MPVNLSVDVSAPNLRHIPDRYEDAFIDGAVKNAAAWMQSVWAAAVSGAMVLPGMSGPVDEPEYARSLGMPSALKRTGKWEYTITAKFDAAQRIEHGYGSYDMKPGLLHGPSARIGKEGQRYNVVPFRFGTPITKGPNKGGARPNFQETMPLHAYKAVKDGERYADTGEGQRTKIPFLFTQDQLGGVNAQAVIRGQIGPMQSVYTWQNGLYDGMKRYGAAGHRQYFTFRIVSQPRTTVTRWRRADGSIQTTITRKGSDPSSWIHPGMGANPVMQAVVNYTRPFVERMLLRAADTIR